MRIRFLALAAGGLVFAMILAFEAGRFSVPANRASSFRKPQTTRLVSAPERKQFPGDELPSSNVLVQNFGKISFIELYDVLEAAPPSQRADWARQLGALPNGPANTSAAVNFFCALMQIDPPTARQLLSSYPSHLLRADILSAVIRAAPNSELDNLANLTAHLTTKEKREFLPQILEQWSRFEPEKACRFAETQLVNLGSETLHALLSNWAETDLDAAKTWLERHDPVRTDTAAVNGLIEAWWKLDPAGALDYVFEHAQENVFFPAIGILGEKLFQLSHERADSWLVSLPPTAAGSAVDAIVDQNLHPENGLNAASAEFLAKWLVTLPSQLRDSKMLEVMGEWASTDSPGLLDWINHSSPQVRDELLTDYCFVNSAKSPQEILDIAFQIKDEKLRGNVLSELVRGLGNTREEVLRKMPTLRLTQSQGVYLRTLLPTDE